MDRRAIVTTANASWMPEFPVASSEQSCTRVDGRWGAQEYTVWPQLYHPRVVHHCCIPCKGDATPVLHFDASALWDAFTPEHWEWDVDCGIPDLGLLNAGRLRVLANCATSVMEHFKGCGCSDRDRKFGTHLAATIRQGIDRLRVLPTWRTNTLALAAHVQRLSLELCGLIVLYNVVQPRIKNPSYIAKRPLPICGAFTADAGTAKGLHRLGVPVWFIQPLTTRVRVLRVVTPTPVSALLSEEASQPRLPWGTGDLTGLVQHPGAWPFKMQEQALKCLLDVTLPPLPTDDLKGPDAPPSKRQRVSGDNTTSTVKSTRAQRRPTHRGMRSAAPTVEPHPSLRYRADNVGEIPSLWSQALAGIRTLPTPTVSSAYFWPPPFLFQGVGQKSDHYYHNYIRIRKFCRQRLLDPTVGGNPLRIVEWRDTLWGDYRVDEVPMSGSSAAVSKEQRQIQQNVRSLFSSTAGLPSYDADGTVQWGDVTHSLESLKDARIRVQVLWEVHKVSWRSELLALDAALTGSHEWATLQRWEREHMVAAVFADGTGLHVVPDWEGGERPITFWAQPPQPSWEAGRRSYRELIRVMARWPGLPSDLRILPESLVMLEPGELSCLELVVLKFYVTSFVRVFNRLPISPAVLPSDWL
ncbi:hypothetical protein FOMPIDRAFT_1136313 [Fomitopsis schrenkii]|uniref:Uncharacterized protein n=1 Tax=Fomitopsis schrenkii TaxID=2126942 RepID=S8DKS0_FOMSC|nr:hypothetical protein FOMPIDRAFT_1136313 [Fomitopsis schrenkii]